MQEASGIDGDYTMLSAREIITKPVEDLKRSVHLKKEENAERQRSHPQSRCAVRFASCSHSFGASEV